MEVGLNYTNIIGNEPILHEICVDFESQSDMKQTHKKRLEKKKRRKFMNRSNFFYKFSLLFDISAVSYQTGINCKYVYTMDIERW